MNAVSGGQILIDFGDICRFCLQNTDSSDTIYDYFTVDELDSENIGSFISKLTLVQMQEGLPTRICETCMEKVLVCYNFRLLCRQTELELQDCYKNTLLKVQNEFEATNDVVKEEPVEYSRDVVSPFKHTNFLHEESSNDMKPFAFISTNEDEKCSTAEKKLIEVKTEPSVDLTMEEKPATLTYEENLTKNPKKLTQPSLERSSPVIAPELTAPKVENASSVCSLWKCKDCDRVYQQKRTLTNHRRMKHKNDIVQKMYACGQAGCTESFAFEGELADHINSHKTLTLENNTQKTIFEKFFTHLLEENVPKYQCDHCQASYLRKSNLFKHIRSKHLKGEEPMDITEYERPKKTEENSSPAEVETKLKHLCRICMKLIDRKEVKKHNREHKKMTRYLCQLCGKVFKGKRTFLDHQNQHAGKLDFICQVCGGAFYSYASLRFHQHRDHGMFPKVHECKICHKQFKGSDTLSRHILTHSGDRKFSCDICPKKFYRRSELDRHIRYHKKEYRYVCSMCGKGFVDGHRFREHMMMHKNVRPFKCEYCDRLFIRKQKMRIHMARKHKVDLKTSEIVFKDPKTYVPLTQLL